MPGGGLVGAVRPWRNSSVAVIGTVGKKPASGAVHISGGSGSGLLLLLSFALFFGLGCLDVAVEEVEEQA